MGRLKELLVYNEELLLQDEFDIDEYAEYCNEIKELDINGEIYE